jgi:hypothetical protein
MTEALLYASNKAKICNLNKYNCLSIKNESKDLMEYESKLKEKNIIKLKNKDLNTYMIQKYENFEI